MIKTSWEKRSAIIVVHQLTTGPAHDLRDYLLEKRIGSLLYIAHPLLYVPEGYNKSSKFSLYKNGKLIKEAYARHWKFPEPILYIKDVIYTLYWSIKMIPSPDVFFGVSNLNAFAGLLYTMIKGKTKVVYYVIDYVPKRFKNRFLNIIYHWIEKTCAEKSQVTWNLSPRMIEARNEQWKRVFSNQFIVPHGVHIKRIKRVMFEYIHQNEILYMGSLLKKQGIQLVISTLPNILNVNPNVTLSIIGMGPYESELRELVKQNKVENAVQFLGYIESHKELENRIAKAAIAIALYDKKYDEFSYYADPGKIKNYLGAGVPVIMTDVPYVARQVEKARCGFIVSYTEIALQKVLLEYFSNQKLMREYKENAVKFAMQFDWKNIFDKALDTLFT